MRSHRQITVAMAAIVALIAALLGASAGVYFTRAEAGGPAGRMAASPASPAVPETEFVTAIGRIESKTPDSFVLRTASGTVVVEVDDTSPLYREASMLRVGERVAVTGAPDGDRRIEAREVFVETLPEPVRASAADEEGSRDGGR